jgi:hypothetical protein
VCNLDEFNLYEVNNSCAYQFVAGQSSCLRHSDGTAECGVGNAGDVIPSYCTVATPAAPPWLGAAGMAVCDGTDLSGQTASYRYQYMDCNGVWGPLGNVKDAAMSLAGCSQPIFEAAPSVGQESTRLFRVNPDDDNQGCMIQEVSGAGLSTVIPANNDWAGNCAGNGGTVNDLAGTYVESADGVIVRTTTCDVACCMN